MNEITTTRSNALIDPHLHVWHGEIPLYLFLGGLAAGVMILTGLWMWRHGRGEATTPSRTLRLLPWAPPALISVGMFFLWLDLEHPFNAWRFYMVFKPASPMSWGAWILLGVYPVSILFAWTATPLELRAGLLAWAGKGRVTGFLEYRVLEPLSRWALPRASGLAVANALLGAALGIYTGVLLGTMAARPLWNSAILGPLFLTSGLSTGAAYMLLHRLEDRERVLLGRADMGLITLELVLLGLWMTGLATGGAATGNALRTILGGPYTVPFWALVVAVGLLTPLAAEWIEHRHGAVPGRLAAVLVLVGGLALRWVLVYAGQYSGIGTELALL
jgi:formate-dependent nitrite reductase membrane component NrfD